MANLSLGHAVLSIAAGYAAAAWLRAPREGALRLLLVLLTVSGLATGRAARPAALPYGIAATLDGREALVRARVREPARATGAGPRTVLDVTAVSYDGRWRPADVGVLVTFAGEAPAAGAVVLAKARFAPFHNLGIAGEYDQEGRERRRHVELRGRVGAGAWTELTPPPPRERLLASLRARIVGAAGRLSPPARGLFLGLTIGDAGGMTPATRAGWRDAGVAHLISISGLHLAIVFLFMRKLVRQAMVWTPGFALRVRADWWAGLVAMPAVVVYALVSGSQAPTLRSLAMLLVILAAQAIGRRAKGFDALCWGTLGLLAADPSLLAAPGFQLSFTAVFGAIAWNQGTAGEPPVTWPAKLRRYVAAALVSSLVAIVWTTPFSAYHFGQASAVGLVANVPLIPYVSFWLTPLCFLFAAVSAAAPSLPLPWPVVEWSCRAADAAVAWFAAAPGAGVDLRLDGIETSAVLTIVAAAGSVALSPKRRWRRRAGAMVALAVALLAAHELVRYREWHVPLRVDVLSVGQGDAVLLTASGRHILIDTGGGQGIYERTLRPYFVYERISSLDALVLTHPHEDHVGGAAALLRDMPVARLVVSDLARYGRLRPDILTAARARSVPIEVWNAGHVETWSRLKLAVLHPSAAFMAALPADGNENEGSLVLRVEAPAGGCVFLPGDAEHAAEAAVLASQVAPCELLKAGHHGSRTSSSTEFLARLAPRWVLVSAGFRNQFRHPHAQTLAKLRAAGIGWQVTAEQGTLTGIYDGSGWNLSAYRPSQHFERQPNEGSPPQHTAMNWLDFVFRN